MQTLQATTVVLVINPSPLKENFAGIWVWGLDIYRFWPKLGLRDLIFSLLRPSKFRLRHPFLPYKSNLQRVWNVKIFSPAAARIRISRGILIFSKISSSKFGRGFTEGGITNTTVAGLTCDGRRSFFWNLRKSTCKCAISSGNFSTVSRWHKTYQLNQTHNLLLQRELRRGPYSAHRLKIPIMIIAITDAY